MKKLLIVALLFVSGLFVVPTSAQVFGQDDYYGRQDRGRHRGWRNNTYTVTEYRYVRYGRMVYRETYRSTYRRNGRLVHRVLINRQRVSRFNRYNDRDFRNEGIRFNIFFRF